MIAKVVHGWRPGGLIAYLLGPGVAEVHRSPRVIASWDGLDTGWQPERIGPSEYDLRLARTHKGGQDGQRLAARRAGVKKIGSFYAGHEEHMDGETRIEIKTGAQIKPLMTAYDKHEKQSDAAKRIGDQRPFVLHVKPEPNGKRQLTTFESFSDDDYRSTLCAMAVQAGVIDG